MNVLSKVRFTQNIEIQPELPPPLFNFWIPYSSQTPPLRMKRISLFSVVQHSPDVSVIVEVVQSISSQQCNDKWTDKYESPTIERPSKCLWSELALIRCRLMPQTMYVMRMNPGGIWVHRFPSRISTRPISGRGLYRDVGLRVSFVRQPPVLESHAVLMTNHQPNIRRILTGAAPPECRTH